MAPLLHRQRRCCTQSAEHLLQDGPSRLEGLAELIPVRVADLQVEIGEGALEHEPHLLGLLRSQGEIDDLVALFFSAVMVVMASLSSSDSKV